MAALVREGDADDLAEVHRMITALAVYEREPDAVKTTVASMKRDWEGGAFGFFIAVSQDAARPCCGFALWHWRYSTWTGRCLFLEDLYVDEDSRKSGVGRELFMAVVRLAAERDAARLQWQVLGWNQSAVEFYKRFGAELTDEWLNGKLVREQLHKLALDSK